MMMVGFLITALLQLASKTKTGLFSLKHLTFRHAYKSLIYIVSQN